MASEKVQDRETAKASVNPEVATNDSSGSRTDIAEYLNGRGTTVSRDAQYDDHDEQCRIFVAEVLAEMHGHARFDEYLKLKRVGRIFPESNLIAAEGHLRPSPVYESPEPFDSSAVTLEEGENRAQNISAMTSVTNETLVGRDSEREGSTAIEDGTSGVSSGDLAGPGLQENVDPLTFLSDDEIKALSQKQRKAFFQACSVFPTVDPRYVQNFIIENSIRSSARVIEHLLGAKFPTLKERLEVEQAELKRYRFLDTVGEHFDVRSFLKIYPCPEEYFESVGRRVNDDGYRKHAMAFLTRSFPLYRQQFISHILKRNSGIMLHAYRELKQWDNEGKLNLRASQLRQSILRPLTENAEYPAFPKEIDEVFFHEVQFCQNQERIQEWLRKEKEKRNEKLMEAERQGVLEKCEVCCNDRLLQEELVFCDQGAHKFCGECVRQHALTLIGIGAHVISCMYPDCNRGVYCLSAIEKVLPPASYNVLLRRVQQEKLRSSNRINVESCPFCEYFMVVENLSDRILRCENPDCMKESCRLCRCESHLPLRCDEVEKDFETRKRKYVEERMTEAIVRKCPRCSTSISKSDGCNKMRCPCGCSFCYVCSEALPDSNPYDHFSTTSCRQFTPLDEIQEEVVRRAGEQALLDFNTEHPEAAHGKVPDIDKLSGINEVDWFVRRTRNTRFAVNRFEPITFNGVQRHRNPRMPHPVAPQPVFGVADWTSLRPQFGWNNAQRPIRPTANVPRANFYRCEFPIHPNIGSLREVVQRSAHPTVPAGRPIYEAYVDGQQIQNYGRTFAPGNEQVPVNRLPLRQPGNVPLYQKFVPDGSEEHIRAQLQTEEFYGRAVAESLNTQHASTTGVRTGVASNEILRPDRPDTPLPHVPPVSGWYSEQQVGHNGFTEDVQRNPGFPYTPTPFDHWSNVASEDAVKGFKPTTSAMFGIDFRNEAEAATRKLVAGLARDINAGNNSDLLRTQAPDPENSLTDSSSYSDDRPGPSGLCRFTQEKPNSGIFLADSADMVGAVRRDEIYDRNNNAVLRNSLRGPRNFGMEGAYYDPNISNTARNWIALEPIALPHDSGLAAVNMTGHQRPMIFDTPDANIPSAGVHWTPEGQMNIGRDATIAGRNMVGQELQEVNAEDMQTRDDNVAFAHPRNGFRMDNP